MEAGTVARRGGIDGLEDDRRPAGARRRAVRRRARRSATSATASGTTSRSREVGEIVSEIARGLIDLGIEPGDRVSLLCTTRPEWTYADFAITSAGGVVVPIYPTNSPEECEWVAGNSESRGDRLRGRRPGGQDRRRSATSCPRSSTIDRHRPGGRRRRRDRARRPARARPRPRRRPSCRARREAVTPEDPYTFIYTSGTTGPPKGCVLTHGNYRERAQHVRGDRRARGGRRRLPLPAARARLRAADPAAGDRPRRHDRLLRRRPEADRPRAEGGPPDLPAVGAADLREDLHARHLQRRPGADQGRRAGRPARCAQLQAAGQEVPAELQAHFDAADEALFKNVRAAFGGKLKQANTGAAPIAKEILEFFYACGVPVLEGYGMTETVDGRHRLRRVERPQARHGRPRAARAARSGSPTTARSCSRARTSSRATTRTRTRVFGHDRRRLAAHGRPRLARRGRLPLDHRPQEGHHHHRGRQEPHAGQHRERPQAVALDLAGRDVRRPPALPGRADHARPRGDRPRSPRSTGCRGRRPRWPRTRRSTS